VVRGREVDSDGQNSPSISHSSDERGGVVGVNRGWIGGVERKAIRIAFE
jgi:hypothetical protein